MVAAFLGETRSIQLIEDGEVVSITPEGARFVDVEDGERRARGRSRSTGTTRPPRRAATRPSCSRRSTSSRRRSRETIGDRVRHGKLVLESLGLTEDEIRNLRRIVIVACGTAYHAGVVGRYMIEEWARLPVEPDIASEWIYRNPVLSKDTLVIGISQSGETARHGQRDASSPASSARARSRSRT